ncbi:MAG TPA: hypothetical protein VGL77_19605 [Armatimonadota bacterium]|jgi:hypothetical protein
MDQLFDADEFGDAGEFLGDFPDERTIFMAELDDALQRKFAGTKWEARLNVMNEETSWEERIALYQALREEKEIPEEAIYFLIAWAIEAMAEERIDETFQSSYAARLAKIKHAHGMEEDDEWEPGSGPAEYEALHAEFLKAVEAIGRAAYQKFGEHKMVERLESDPEEADRIYEAGYNYINELIDQDLFGGSSAEA